MYNITIEKEISYAGRTDVFTVEQGDKSIPITHEVSGFMHKNVKLETKKLSYYVYLKTKKSLSKNKKNHLIF